MYKILSIACVVVVLLGACSGKYKTKEELFAEGMKQINANKPGGAIVYFKNALEKDQNYFDARFQLAKTYSEIGKLDFAEKELQKTRRQRPASREVRIELAKVLVRTSKADDALSEIGDYVTDTSTEPDVLETAGLALALKGDYKASLVLLKRAIAAQDKALSALDEAIKKNPNEGILYELKEKTLVAQNRYSDALSTIKDLEKSNFQADFSYIVSTYFIMDKPEKALAQARKESSLLN